MNAMFGTSDEALLAFFGFEDVMTNDSFNDPLHLPFLSVSQER